MYASISLLVAEQRARDMQNEATLAHRAREARLARRARRARRAHTVLGSVRLPESYEDFLCQTAESVMREPTASGRAGGQTVR
jgi:hypothetical protein